MNLDDAGDVVLKDLQLKAEALNALKLPITVKAGFLGSVTLKVHYSGVSDTTTLSTFLECCRVPSDDVTRSLNVVGLCRFHGTV